MKVLLVPAAMFCIASHLAYRFAGIMGFLAVVGLFSIAIMIWRGKR